MSPYRSFFDLVRRVRPAAPGFAAAAAVYGEPGPLLALHAAEGTSPCRAR